jgi:hypothetical protein
MSDMTDCLDYGTTESLASDHESEQLGTVLTVVAVIIMGLICLPFPG